jgi:DNA-binding SARP family transcriptional activator
MLWQLAGGRAAVLRDVAAAGSLWGAAPVTAALDRANSPSALLDRLTDRLLERCDAGQLAALRVLLDTGYWHPRLTAPDAGVTLLRPWAVSLEDGWCQLRPVWARSLRRHLPGRLATTGPGPVRRPVPAPGPAFLQARLFGELEVRVDGRRVDRWSGLRGSGVLRLLLTRPQHACTRDELLATFWPDVEPAVARNRLQVAVSAVRKAFLDVTPVPVVEYAEGSYRINPALRVEVDVERFETGLAAARRADRSGDTAAALAAYAEATAWFRGDFAADAPYEPWTLLPRESLRMSHLDALDRMGALQVAEGAFEDGIATARRMLEADPCREDAHRLLMRCEARLGRPYQALRQYEFCCRVLRSTLDVAPAAATTRLYDEIRAGLLVAPT